ncbi:hypothetical protein BH23CHL2_BH23CHL2_11090 [soil metagenome]
MRHYSTPLILLGFLSLALVFVPGTTIAGYGAGGDSELWVNGQDTDQIFILDGLELVDTVALPAGSGPHMTTFTPSGELAYVAAISSGDLIIIDAVTREIIDTLDFGSSGVHQAAVSPDGSILMVALIPTNELVRIAVDTRAQTWVETGRLALPAAPVCTVFVPGTTKAYVSLAGQDLAIIDVANLTIEGVVDLNGQARCNFSWSKDGSTLFLTAENGVDSFLYTLDPATESLELLYTFVGVADLHTPAPSPNGKELYVIGRGNDRFYTLDLATLEVVSFEIGTPGVSDQPDGMMIRGNNAYINLKATGEFMRVKIRQQRAQRVGLVEPSRNALTNLVERP